MPEDFAIARLNGFDIIIQPLANLVPSDTDSVYGIIVRASHAELERLYAHAEHVLGGKYLPEAVLVDTLDGEFRPALCYIAPELAASSTEGAYVDRIVKPAREYGFPEWYIQRLESFKPTKRKN